MSGPRSPELSGHCFLWLDLETTGLDPHSCRILEWAVVLAADDREGDMSVVDSYEGVIGMNAKDWEAAQKEMDPFAFAMHSKNGLLEECLTTGDDNTLADADAFLAGLCEQLGAKPRSVVLAGSTVHFDLGFIRVHMPLFTAYLSHRCFDVSTLKMADRDWGGEKFKKAEAHRAMPDVLESLEHAAEIRRSISRWAQP